MEKSRFLCLFLSLSPIIRMTEVISRVLLIRLKIIVITLYLKIWLFWKVIIKKSTLIT